MAEGSEVGPGKCSASPLCWTCLDAVRLINFVLTLIRLALVRCFKSIQIKWPTKGIIVNDDELPKTKTKKYIRVNLSTHLAPKKNPKKNKGKQGTKKPSPPPK